MSVYDRLYNSRPSKEHSKQSLSLAKTPKKAIKNNQVSNHKPNVGILSTRTGKSYKDYCGYVSLGHRSRAYGSNQFFSLSSDSRGELAEKSKKRQPTPVAHKDQMLSTMQSIPNYFHNSIDNRSDMCITNNHLPKFAFENPSCDDVELNSLVDFDNSFISISSLVQECK